MSFAIIDLEGQSLSSEEHELLGHPIVAGVLLFSRNYENPTQLRSLTTDIKKINPSLFIGVDQEGGRVQRFRKGFTNLPSMRHFGQWYQHDSSAAKKNLTEKLQTVIRELKEAGIDVNFAPVLDIDHGQGEIIAERSFSSDPSIVEALGDFVIDLFHANHMPAIGKHFPGHGGVAADSHHSLPVDQRDQDTILNDDLFPFAKLSRKLDAIMPAHIVYTAFDPKPASFSRFWLQDMLRQRFAFQGVIISDDLTMAGAAVMGDHLDRAVHALQAGCDLLTICNDRQGVIAVLEGLLHYKNPESEERIKKWGRTFHSRKNR